MPPSNDERVVYESGKGRIRHEKQKPAAAIGDGNVRVGRETKGRKGKGMTVITGLPLKADDLKDLAKDLKQKCGTGGAVKGNVIEIQGDHRDTIVDYLSTKGYKAKRSGG